MEMQLFTAVCVCVCLCASMTPSPSLFERRADAHHHHGLASEGDPGLLQLPRGQPARVALLDSVHPGRGDTPAPAYSCVQIDKKKTIG